MTLLVKNKILIEQSIDKVYEYVTDMENFGDWFPGVIKITSQNKLKHGEVGKKYLETVKDPFRGKVEILIEVKKALTNSYFVTEGEYPPLLPKMSVQFSGKQNNSTEISWSMESRSNNMLIQILIIPLARIIMKKRAKSGIINLKRKLESGNNKRD